MVHVAFLRTPSQSENLHSTLAMGLFQKTSSLQSTHKGTSLYAIATRMEAIAIRLEAIASRLEAIAIRLEAIASRLEAIQAIVSIDFSSDCSKRLHHLSGPPQLSCSSCLPTRSSCKGSDTKLIGQPLANDSSSHLMCFPGSVCLGKVAHPSHGVPFLHPVPRKKRIGTKTL